MHDPNVKGITKLFTSIKATEHQNQSHIVATDRAQSSSHTGTGCLREVVLFSYPIVVSQVRAFLSL